MLTKAEKCTLRKFRYRSTVTMSEDKFEKIAPSCLFYPVLKPGQYWWGGSGSVKVRLTDAGERALEEHKAVAWQSIAKFIGLLVAIPSTIAAILAIIGYFGTR